MKFTKFILIFCFFIVLSFPHEPIKPTFIRTKPKIDGVIDESLWKSVRKVTGFKTFVPDFGKNLSEKTEVYLAYDNENLFFAFKCFDREPQKIKSSLTTRDNIRDEDWVCINLDSFNDQQSLYSFYVNPLGVQADSRYTGNTEDAGIDLVWYSAGKLDQDGYSIEIQIPLKSIRYANTNPVEMAVFLERKISRNSEQGSIPELDADKGYAFMTQLQPLFYNDLKHYTLLEFLPAVTFNQKYISENKNLKIDEVNRNASLTLKYGITSDLIFDGTYNPDFSQVEADAGQVDINLRHSLFYPEKRPFFLEGRENFGISGTRISEVDPIRSIIHTRTIINPVIGLKVAGKIGEKNTIAVLYAKDEEIDNSADDKFIHYPILRYKRSLSEDSFLGGMIALKEEDESYNRVYGIDGQVRIGVASQVEFSGLFSQTKKSQNSTNINDHSFGIKYYKGDRESDLSISINDVGKSFNAEMGYVNRTGITTIAGLFKPKFYPTIEFISRIDVEVFSAQTKDNFFDKWETFNHLSALAYLWGNLQLKVKYSYSTEIFNNIKFDTGGFHIFSGGWLTNYFYAGILYRGRKSIFYDSNPFQGTENVLSSDFILRPTDKLVSEINIQYRDFTRESDDFEIYDYLILRGKLSYQVNKFLFFRGIVEYNNYREELMTDFLASFTYIPGTVIHLGYGSRYDRVEEINERMMPIKRFEEMKRGFFFKASYLWRI